MSRMVCCVLLPSIMTHLSCSAKTQAVLRIEGSLSPGGASKSLKPCPRCLMAFFCCGEHRDSALSVHNAPWNELPGALSECEMSRQVRVEVEYRTIMTAPQLVMWRFIRRQQAWTSLNDLTWDAVFGTDVRTAVAERTSADQAAACLRHVSSLASTAMTVLHALEQLNAGADWTTRSSLTIHVQYLSSFLPLSS